MELKTVELTTSLDRVKKGATGTILFDYGREVYEVEFIVDGKSFVETVHADDIEIIK